MSRYNGQGMEKRSFWDSDIRATYTVVPKPVGEAMTWAIITLRKRKNVRVNRIVKIGMFKQALSKEVVSPLSECFMAIDIMSCWRTLLLPCVVRQESVDGILMEAIVRDVRVDESRQKFIEELVCLNRLYEKWLHLFYLIVFWRWTLYLTKECFPYLVL